jgi:hypothetical protein
LFGFVESEQMMFDQRMLAERPLLGTSPDRLEWVCFAGFSMMGPAFCLGCRKKGQEAAKNGLHDSLDKM